MSARGALGARQIELGLRDEERFGRPDHPSNARTGPWSPRSNRARAGSGSPSDAPICDEPGGVVVAQVVDPTGRTYGFGDGLSPYSPKGPAPEYRSSFGRPHHATDRRICFETLDERVNNESGKGDGSLGGLRLGRSQRWGLSRCLDECRPYRQPPAKQVEIRHPEASKLAPAQAGVGRHDHEGGIPAGERCGACGDLVRVEQPQRTMPVQVRPQVPTLPRSNQPARRPSSQIADS